MNNYLEVLKKPIVWVAALGYFVDIFDLVLFGMLRVDSLKGLGITESNQLESYGLMLDNWQMGGMLIGGIVWGIIGDKKGRLSVLFGSIITYSIANIANGIVDSVSAYAVWRFIAGFGLAGELGAGITIVSEVLKKEVRGIGTAFVATMGVSGAVVGGTIVTFLKTHTMTSFEPWRETYVIGGLMGVVLLILRIGVKESLIFEKTKHKNVIKGNFKTLIKNKKQFKKYIGVILIATPIWYAVQLYAKYAPEMAESLGIVVEDKGNLATKAIMFMYMGLTIGDACSGIFSNIIKSRKKTIVVFLIISAIGISIFWSTATWSLTWLYASIIIIGFGIGYWAVFMTTAAESFGTNIRSTVTNTAPNFVRGSVILINALYLGFQKVDGISKIGANLLVGVVVFSLAIWGWRQLEETFHKDLDYVD